MSHVCRNLHIPGRGPAAPLHSRRSLEETMSLRTATESPASGGQAPSPASLLLPDLGTSLVLCCLNCTARGWPRQVSTAEPPPPQVLQTALGRPHSPAAPWPRQAAPGCEHMPQTWESVPPPSTALRTKRNKVYGKVRQNPERGRRSFTRGCVLPSEPSRGLGIPGARVCSAHFQTGVCKTRSCPRPDPRALTQTQAL